MGLLSRLGNVFRGERLNGEIQEEMEAHLAEAVAQGRDPVEARRAFGSTLRRSEESHSLRVVGWLDSLRADAVFGWRQLMKRKVTTGAAVLSLALGIGACLSAFRLVDALLFRALPVTAPERLYGLFREGNGPGDGKPSVQTWFEYPVFQQMRAAVKEQADVIAVSYARRTDVTYRSAQEMEKAQVQYVSGAMFGAFGLQPVLGRLLTEGDDVTPGAHPYAVISYDYWVQRFGKDPNMIGRTFHMSDSAFELGDNVYEIVGVGPKSFTGTESGTVTDVFLPTMMYPGVTHPEWAWIRMLVALKPGASAKSVQDRLGSIFDTMQRERAKGFTGRPKQFFERFFSWHLRLEPAPTGISNMQEDYRLPLMALSVLVLLVLLIACANVANLMTAQATERTREMALRVSIGAGRRRLIQLLLVESAFLAAIASLLGGLFAWWSAPMVVNMISTPNRPVRLVLPADWTVAGVGVALAVAVTLLFGMIPALRASRVQPVSALKGGEEPQARRRLIHGLIAVQVAFCVVVLFVAGLFAATFEKLINQPMGFTAEHVLLIDTLAEHPQAPVVWDQMAERLRAVAGVEKVGISIMPLLQGDMFGSWIAVNGVRSQQLASNLSVTPGWLETMRIPLFDGRDFRDSDRYPNVAIVSKTFAKEYFGGANPIGRTFQAGGSKELLEVVGLVGDARYQSVRETPVPVFYVPFQGVDDKGALLPLRNGTFTVRSFVDNPEELAQTLRRTVVQGQPQFRVTSVRTQTELIAAQTIRERLLATLATFFGGVALLLAAIGLYGVLHYSVLQREKEIGIRIAVGAQAGNIARLVTTRVFAMVMVGAVVGLGLGMASVRFVATLLYGVKGTDLSMLLVPTVVLMAAAGLAALPAVMRAVRIDPATMLRAE